MSGSISIDDSAWVRVNLDVRNNNQWKENAFIFDFKDKACSMISSHIPGFYHVVFDKDGKAPKSPCIIPAGVYVVNQEPIDWTFPNFPVLPYGHYQFKIRIGYLSSESNIPDVAMRSRNMTVEDARSCISSCQHQEPFFDQCTSPSTSSWDGIFEASDLLRDNTTVSKRPTIVKRALFCNQEKGDNSGMLFASSSANTSLETLLRFFYPSHLKVLQAKVALNSGKYHLSSRGKERLARHIRQPCHASCKRCEKPKLTDDERRSIFNKFWSLNGHEQQWKFISDSVMLSLPKRKSASIGAKGAKTNTRSYYFNTSSKPKRLYKTMFKNTLCICDSWIDNALSHFSNGTHIPDMRGKAYKKIKIKEEQS
ncbi:uncharacterized protein LOC127751367 isoform X2 [Frankliniella occidentalis]|nr:uncharacterized protein LOC127751367 isoform X2 [Frankliniella occidentalis]XP_052130796.1 uncharacterized protein LOC127751367 isoform X2 [Frankliniella occidentalis]XP_052130797.1 uncharacterized protein LOC127751367 isoform X2 [Frankliniella occidentalis]XP_052130798.1 uncharacterized protein LOC127751367 isoform X2 [Frankliniella occidentalis]